MPEELRAVIAQAYSIHALSTKPTPTDKETDDTGFPQNFVCKNMLQKVAFMQGFLQAQKAGSGGEDRLRKGLDLRSESGSPAKLKALKKSRLPEDLP
jgi:hypothetical protein